ncbi:MAG: DNA polymerase IV [Gammaproteobacteria bacterium]
MRKIIHVDMDAFYASVEQRDDPSLRGKPVIVAWQGLRSVVCAASYEARRFGVRSAMPAVRAERLCPHAIFIPPDFTRYRDVSRAVRGILARYTDIIEPLSLDEAYLDATENKVGLSTATRVARCIRQDIVRETGLTASAGVAPNKFLAKIASDWRKPDGLFVIQPHEVADFLAPLAVGRLPGVGRATEHQLNLLGVATVRDLRRIPRQELQRRFGRFGERLAKLAVGEDSQPVEPDRPLQQVSVEHTLETDLLLADLVPVVRDTANRAWLATRKTGRIGRTVVLKLKTAGFQTLTRSHTPGVPPASAEDVAEHALALLARIELAPDTRYRLAGVGVTGFPTVDTDEQQPDLF